VPRAALPKAFRTRNLEPFVLPSRLTVLVSIKGCSLTLPPVSQYPSVFLFLGWVRCSFSFDHSCLGTTAETSRVGGWMAAPTGGKPHFFPPGAAPCLFCSSPFPARFFLPHSLLGQARWCCIAEDAGGERDVGLGIIAGMMPLAWWIFSNSGGRPTCPRLGIKRFRYAGWGTSGVFISRWRRRPADSGISPRIHITPAGD